MEAEKFEALPIAIQIVMGLGLFVGAIVATIIGLLKKNFKLGTLLSSETDGKDAVVMSAAIADSAKIAELASAIKLLVEYLKENDLEQTRELRKTHGALTDINDNLERLITVTKVRNPL